MEKIYGFIGIVAFYLITRYFFFRRKNEPDPITEVLTNSKYKVKGQWDE